MSGHFPFLSRNTPLLHLLTSGLVTNPKSLPPQRFLPESEVQLTCAEGAARTVPDPLGPLKIAVQHKPCAGRRELIFSLLSLRRPASVNMTRREAVGSAYFTRTATSNGDRNAHPVSDRSRRARSQFITYGGRGPAGTEAGRHTQIWRYGRAS